MTKVLHRVGWIGLTLIAAFLLFAVANDLRADHSTGLPVDHTGAFTAVAGQSFDTVRQSTPAWRGTSPPWKSGTPCTS
jgi:hypothetical protein